MVEKTVLSLSYGRILVKPQEKLHGLVPESFETYQVVEDGDIICRPTDLQNDQTSLRFGLSNHRGIITSAYMCFNTVDTLSRPYGYLLLHAYDLKKVFYGLGSGLRQNLDWKDFKYLPSLVPPLDEQDAIVRFLKHYDRKIRRYIRVKQKLIKLMEEQRQAIIHRTVTRGLDPNVRLKPSGVAWLGDIPEHWEVLPIKRAFVSMEYGISESATNDGSIRLLTMGNIRDGHVTIPPDGGVPTVDPTPTLQKNDLLFNRTNSAELVGKVGLFRGAQVAVTFASYLVRMRPRQDNNAEFLNLLLNDSAVLSAARREAIPSLHQSNLNPTRYGRLHIALPRRSEQEAIVGFVKDGTNSLNQAIERACQEIELFREYRTRLIADVVTGKLDVREVANQLPDEPEGPEFMEDVKVAEERDMETASLEAGVDD